MTRQRGCCMHFPHSSAVYTSRTPVADQSCVTLPLLPPLPPLLLERFCLLCNIKSYLFLFSEIGTHTTN